MLMQMVMVFMMTMVLGNFNPGIKPIEPFVGDSYAYRTEALEAYSEWAKELMTHPLYGELEAYYTDDIVMVYYCDEDFSYGDEYFYTITSMACDAFYEFMDELDTQSWKMNRMLRHTFGFDVW